MFDSHAHLNFKDFDKDRSLLIKKCLKQNIGVINVGADLETSKKAIEIARESKSMYASVGVHPLHAEEDFDFSEIEKLTQKEKVIAIGETGLDYQKKKTIKKQEDLFSKHLELAVSKNIPLIIHSRKAHNDTLEMIPKWKGVIHCFTGNLTQAEKYIKKGFLIGLNGIIFKLNLKKVIKEIPVEKIILETDCPFLTPPGKSGKNTPLGVREVAAEVARIKGVDIDKLEKITDQNVKETFDI